MAHNQHFWRINHLATGLLIVLASVLPPLSLPSVAAPPARVPARVPTRVSQSLSWGDLIKLLAPRRTAGGSRTYAFCWVTMSELANVTNLVARNRPTFYWQSGASAIGVRILGENQPIWKKSVSSKANATSLGISQIRYDGEPLEAGVDYELVSYMSSGSPGKIANFQVLTAEAQANLAAQLKPLTGKDEATLLKRVTIYSENQLTTDAMGELLTAPGVGPEVKKMIHQVPQTWCPKPESSLPAAKPPALKPPALKPPVPQP
jgi:hypothetical protein